MKTTIYILAVILGFCWLSGMKVTFNPFTVKFESLGLAVGWLLIGIGIIFVTFHTGKQFYNRGYKRAFNDAYDVLDEYMSDKLKESKTETPDPVKTYKADNNEFTTR